MNEESLPRPSKILQLRNIPSTISGTLLQFKIYSSIRRNFLSALPSAEKKRGDFGRFGWALNLSPI